MWRKLLARQSDHQRSRLFDLVAVEVVEIVQRQRHGVAVPGDPHRLLGPARWGDRQGVAGHRVGSRLVLGGRRRLRRPGVAESRY